METLSLTQYAGDWASVIDEVEHTGMPVALTFDGLVCGLLLPSSEVQEMLARVRSLANVQSAPVQQANA